MFRQYRRVTYGQTDRRTSCQPRHSPRYAYASRGKNRYLKCRYDTDIHILISAIYHRYFQYIDLSHLICAPIAPTLLTQHRIETCMPCQLACEVNMVNYLSDNGCCNLLFWQTQINKSPDLTYNIKNLQNK